MKRIAVISSILFSLISCATTVKFNANHQEGDYLNIDEALVKSEKSKLIIGKQEQYLLSPNGYHLYEKEEDYRTAIAVFEITFENEDDYTIEIISLPNSLGNNPTIMDPVLNVYNSENDSITVDMKRKDFVQTQILSDKSIQKKYKIKVLKSGIHFVMVLANLDTENGIVVEYKEKDGKTIRNQELKLTPYGRFKINISRE